MCDGIHCENCVGFGKLGECINYLMADHFIDNGVIVPPCKVGDTIYFVSRGEIIPMVTGIVLHDTIGAVMTNAKNGYINTNYHKLPIKFFIYD